MAQRIRVQDFAAAMRRKMDQRAKLVEAAAVETAAQAVGELVARTDAAGWRRRRRRWRCPARADAARRRCAGGATAADGGCVGETVARAEDQ